MFDPYAAYQTSGTDARMEASGSARRGRRAEGTSVGRVSLMSLTVAAI